MISAQLKSHGQTLLRRLGLYHRLRASVLYDVYWRIVDKEITAARDLEVNFYRTHLHGFRPGDIFFDIGANHGYKTDVFLRLGARVVAIDPDEHNQDVLRESFLTWRISPRPVVILGQAVSDTESLETMWIDEPGSAKNTLNRKWVDILRVDGSRFGRRLAFANERTVETVTLDSLIQRYGPPFFVKIDVEGYEPQVVRGLHRPIQYLSFEVNLPEFRPEGHECVEMLRDVAPDAVFNYTVDCRRGFALKEWVSASEFDSVFNNCTDNSIEIFWNASLAAARWPA